ncbi:M23 family metallopeptidase [Anoxynatronum buryatiense]|uniref:Peptidase family M23 n=1 Tax=Anoxynatronum buryatiense TaxID=489973 RepID=A0AA46AIX9_9CLOT|nr:peptidoglycan DD-metalloendopeptidase family protein [Anoxynatronum buryatiense]SMP54331.1 Peptidase family M23 [Anoxynatronum buryatiense]
MKRRGIIFLLLPAVIFIAVAGALIWDIIPMPLSLINGFSVVHADEHEHTYYELSASEALTFRSGLSRQSSPALTARELPVPMDSAVEFQLTLHLKIPWHREYRLLATDEGHLFISQGNDTYRQVDEPAFFHQHPAFSAMYPYSRPPRLHITGAAAPFESDLHLAEWAFERWDHTWVTVWPSTNSGIIDEFQADLPEPATFSISEATVPLILSLDPFPDHLMLRVTDPAGTLRYDGLLETPELPLFPYNGTHQYALEMAWTDENKPYQGAASTAFVLEMDLLPVFELPGPTALQGELLTFCARHLPPDATVELQQELASNVRLFPLEDGYVAYLPTHYGTSTGDHTLRYGLTGEPLQESKLTLLPREFHIQHLAIDAGVAAATRNEAAYAQSAKYFTPSRDESASERYYTEPFIIPVHGRLTTEFGETRYVNNAPTSYRHSGLDIAAPTGTPVAATNRGRVALAMDLIMQGKTVVIDHGQGLFSVHFHLHELLVATGDLVEQGDVIGTVGTTGFSTGPHLHFTMSYYRHNLEPGHFLVGEPITYQNAPHHLSPD